MEANVVSTSFTDLDNEGKSKMVWFSDKLEDHTGLTFDTTEPKAHSKFITVQNHLPRLLINERNQAVPNALILSCKPQTYMCDVFITSVITDMKPR